MSKYWVVQATKTAVECDATITFSNELFPQRNSNQAGNSWGNVLWRGRLRLSYYSTTESQYAMIPVSQATSTTEPTAGPVATKPIRTQSGQKVPWKWRRRSRLWSKNGKKSALSVNNVTTQKALEQGREKVEDEA